MLILMISTQGAFDQQLWKTMGGAKNVILVWTKGCMERFLDEKDPTNQGVIHRLLMCISFERQFGADFVRKEYALALHLKKNIVPVAHEEFDWPDRSRLPKDCEAVMGLNAVK
jgi:hypothetical protein